MAKYREVYITIEEFAELQNTGRQYEGFVTGLGYAYVDTSMMPPPNLRGYTNFGGYMPATNKFTLVRFQYVDNSPEMVEMSRKGAIQKEEYHTVKSGDTLSALAVKYKVKVDDLVKWNRIADPDKIVVGQRLVVVKTATKIYPSNAKDKVAVKTSSSETKDSDNWWANTKTVVCMFGEWDLGVGPANRVFKNDRVANAFRNAWKVNEAREFFYKKYAGITDLTGASVTNYSGKFGLKGLIMAGIDPVEQFVGSYRLDIHVIEGNMLQFTITNTTSMKSFLYGIGPEWERSSFKLNGNTQQTYIFTEPIK